MAIIIAIAGLIVIKSRGSHRGWRTYQADTYSFEYPTQFEAVKKTDDIVEVSGPGSYASSKLEIVELKSTAPEGGWESFLPSDNSSIDVYDKTTLIISGKAAYEFSQSFGSHYEKHVFIERDKWTAIDASYATWLNYSQATGQKIYPEAPNDLTDPNVATFDQIIRTIRFP